MNAIKFLTNEHNKIRRSFAVISKKPKKSAAKKRMFKNLCQYLIVHETTEQKAWYPNFRNSKKLKREVKHLVAEEKTAAKAINKIKTIKNDPAWETKFSKLKKAVLHHAKEEEQKLFPNVEEILDNKKLKVIGKRLASFKKSFAKKLKKKAKEK